MYFLGYCSGLYPIINLVKIVIKLIQFAVPIALILFGSIDFAKAVIAQKDDEMRKALSIFIKRLIYAVVVFFVIVIVRLVMNVLASASLVDEGGNELSVNDWRRCWDCESLNDCKQVDAASEGHGDKIDWETEYPGSEYYDNVSYETFESDTDVTSPSKRITCYKQKSSKKYTCVRQKLTSTTSTDSTVSAPVLYSVKDLGNGEIQVVHSKDAVNVEYSYVNDGKTVIEHVTPNSSGTTVVTVPKGSLKGKTLTFYVSKYDSNKKLVISNKIDVTVS